MRHGRSKMEAAIATAPWKEKPHPHTWGRALSSTKKERFEIQKFWIGLPYVDEYKRLEQGLPPRKYIWGLTPRMDAAIEKGNSTPVEL